MIKEETYGMLLGTVYLVIGLVLLMSIFTIALSIVEDPVGTYDGWFPEEEAAPEGPVAGFIWQSENLTVYFEDASGEGDADITSWSWDFGDSSSSTQENPEHTYSNYGDYRVTLTVTDSDGLSDEADTRVIVSEESNNGETFDMNDLFGSFDLGLNLGSVFKVLGVILLVMSFAAIGVMVGGRVLMAGWHLVRPMPKKFTVKVKPKEMEVVVPSQYQYMQPQGQQSQQMGPQQPLQQAPSQQPMQQPPQQPAPMPAPAYVPPQTPAPQAPEEPNPFFEETRCPSCGEEVKPHWKTCPNCQEKLE